MAADAETMEARVAELEEKIEALAYHLADVIGDCRLDWIYEVTDVGTVDEGPVGYWKEVAA